jgi:hypothetical protein
LKYAVTRIYQKKQKQKISKHQLAARQSHPKLQFR